MHSSSSETAAAERRLASITARTIPSSPAHGGTERLECVPEPESEVREVEAVTARESVSVPGEEAYRESVPPPVLEAGLEVAPDDVLSWVGRVGAWVFVAELKKAPKEAVPVLAARDSRSQRERRRVISEPQARHQRPLNDVAESGVRLRACCRVAHAEASGELEARSEPLNTFQSESADWGIRSPTSNTQRGSVGVQAPRPPVERQQGRPGLGSVPPPPTPTELGGDPLDRPPHLRGASWPRATKRQPEWCGQTRSSSTASSVPARVTIGRWPISPG